MDFAKKVSLWILDPVSTYRAETYSGVEYFTCRAFWGVRKLVPISAILHHGNAISALFLLDFCLHTGESC
jgi:hypothetical protein